LGCAFGGLNIYAGRCIKRRSKRALTLIVACLNTLAVPLGTILGVCTLLVLTRRSVKKLYER
jgi:ABC-type sulfate transport system permease subunit